MDGCVDFIVFVLEYCIPSVPMAIQAKINVALFLMR